MTGLQISTLILTISFAVCAFLWFVAIVGTLTADPRTVKRRLERLRGKEKSIFAGLNDKNNNRRRKIINTATGETLRRRNRLMDTIFNELILAGVVMRPEEFSIIWLVLAFVPSGLVALIGKQMLPAITIAALGAAAPIIYLKVRKKKRVSMFESQLSDALVVCCNCLRSGLSFQQAMETIASDMSAPISTEFSRALNEIKYGAAMDTALNNLAKRIKSADLMLVVSAVNIQRNTGGNLSEILSSISETIKDRLKIKGEIASMTAQGRMSGMVIGALPIALGAILMVINPEYMMVFFTTSAGNIMIAVSVILEIIGFVVIRKVVTIDY